MKPQSLIMLVVAGACGLAAMVLTQRFLAAPSKKTVEETASVVVASIEIQPGTTLNETMFKTIEHPKNFLPAGAVTEATALVGRSTRYHMVPQEVITDAKLAPEGVKSGLETVIEEGKRAITVGIPTDRSVAGFIKPNSHVDIMLQMRSQGPSKPALIKTILQDVKVLAVNTEMQAIADGENRGKIVEMVTFLVAPDEAEKLSLAAESGVLSLRLRSSIDREEVASKKLTLDEVLSDRSKDEDDAKTDPKSIFLTKDGKAAKRSPSGLAGLLASFGLGKKREAPDAKLVAPPTPQVAAAAPVALAPTVPPVPRKKVKRLVYRDLEGKPLMEILLDAESKMAANLEHMLEEVESPRVAAAPMSMPSMKMPPMGPSDPPGDPRPTPGTDDVTSVADPL